MEYDMGALDRLIENRRSIRKYRTEIPEAGMVEAMVRAAAMAPSPSNSQPVRFVRIESAGARAVLRDAMETGKAKMLEHLESEGGPRRFKNWINAYWRYTAFMFDAPLLFAVGTVREREGFVHKLADAGMADPAEADALGRSAMDLTCGLALKGFLLKAAELGLGTCVLTAPLSFAKNVESLLGACDLSINCFLTAGFPDEQPTAPPRKPVNHFFREI